MHFLKSSPPRSFSAETINMVVNLDSPDGAWNHLAPLFAQLAGRNINVTHVNLPETTSPERMLGLLTIEMQAHTYNDFDARQELGEALAAQPGVISVLNCD